MKYTPCSEHHMGPFFHYPILVFIKNVFSPKFDTPYCAGVRSPLTITTRVSFCGSFWVETFLLCLFMQTLKRGQWDQKIFLTQVFLPNFFGPNSFLDLFFLLQICLDSFFGPNLFLPKSFWTQNLPKLCFD